MDVERLGGSVRVHTHSQELTHTQTQKFAQADNITGNLIICLQWVVNRPVKDEKKSKTKTNFPERPPLASDSSTATMTSSTRSHWYRINLGYVHADKQRKESQSEIIKSFSRLHCCRSVRPFGQPSSLCPGTGATHHIFIKKNYSQIIHVSKSDSLQKKKE